MTPHVQTGPEPGLASLTAGILHDGQELLRHQFNLFRHEIEVKIRQTAEASACLAIGFLISLVGAGLLGLTLVFLIHEVGHLPLWASFAIVGGGLAVIGGGLAFAGVRQIQSMTPVPEQSAEVLKEELEWTTNQK